MKTNQIRYSTGHSTSQSKSHSKSRSLRNLPVYIGLSLFSVSALVVFLYMLATAMTPQSYSMPYPPILIPDSFYLENFKIAWNSNNFGAYFANSVFVTVIATLLIVIVSCMCAYAFARMKFPGRDLLFNLFLFSMMVPTLTNLVAQFTLLQSMHLVDKYTGLILIYVGIGIASNTYFLRSFFLGLPHELEEAMIMDGGTNWTIFRHLVLPLSKPAIATFGILAFSNTWDEFLLALTLIKTPDKRTLPIAIKLFEGQHVNNWSLIFAASLIAIVPILIIYIAFQKNLIKGGALDGTLKE